ncbi:MAG: hypothetical protein KBT40_02765 [bacterium]|nr:hypothetical protein [Candidatus Minthenecus merdequi]
MVDKELSVIQQEKSIDTSKEKWCVVRIPGPRYKMLSKTMEKEFEVRKRENSKDQMGYIFLKHNPDTLTEALRPYYGAFPLWDCANNKRPATLTESELELFTKILKDTDLNLIFLDHDLSFYAEGHVPVVCIDPPLEGMTGYIVRRNSNRNFVFSLSNVITISATNAHELRFLSQEDYIKEKSNGLI